MKYEKYQKKFDRFISKNIDLVSSYEEINSEYIKDYEYDIYQLFEKAEKINKSVDLTSFLYRSLVNAISSKCNILDAINEYSNKELFDYGDKNITQQYFDEINRIYTKNNNDYDIEYCEENRDKLIEMNLKSVIAIAKRYQGLGLSLNELISAGNLGLCYAYDKFDPSRAKLKETIIEIIDAMEDVICYEDFYDIMKEHLSYGSLKEKFEHKFKPDKVYSKDELKYWVEKNVMNAKFNSVANMWIKAYIIIEIDNNSRIVKKPKVEIHRDKEEYGSYQRELTVDIDAPISDKNDTTLGEVLNLEEDEDSELEVAEAYKVFKDNLNILLEGVKSRDRQVLLKKFGIGLPRPMLPKEIAEQEGLSPARVSQIFQSVLIQMQQNAKKYDVKREVLEDIIQKIL